MDSRALLTLSQWLSPAYPVGSFAYSHGLEWSIEAGGVTDADTLERWVRACVEHGAGRSDAILLAHAYHATAPEETEALALALQPSAERRLESRAQGAAFAQTTASVWPEVTAPDREIAYPVAVGRAARAVGCPLGATVGLFLQAFAATLISAGVRLVPVGQTEGQAILARLMPLIGRLTEEVAEAGLGDVGGSAIRAEIASMRHETQRTRLFRS